MGSAYSFLQKSGLVDLSKFTGIESQRSGLNIAKYPGELAE